ncbi:MAG: asparaginase [Candidatus Faecivicinus sp.]|nr:asparaginase [Candidatus Faecivicinus sp.]
MKKIALLATGGTIASIHSPSGLVPGVSARELIDRVPGLSEAAEIAARDVFSLDSSNIQPEEWRVLARVAFDALSECDGAVITHGTDTMAYSAAALSFMLHAPRGPVVFTGSQLPLNHPHSDADSKLREAIEVARTAPPGVYVVFNPKIIHGARAVKLRTTSFDAFDSVNALPVGFLDAEGAHYRIDTIAARGEPALLDELDPRVFLLKLMPGTAPEIFDWIAESGMRGVVLEAFGLGGLHYIRRNLVDKLKMLGERGVCTLVTTQCLYEKTNFNIYEVGRNVLSDRVFSARDMTSEAAVAKLMWVLGDPEKRMKLIEKNVCGEMQGAGK